MCVPIDSEVLFAVLNRFVLGEFPRIIDIPASGDVATIVGNDAHDDVAVTDTGDDDCSVLGSNDVTGIVGNTNSSPQSSNDIFFKSFYKRKKKFLAIEI